MLPANVGMPLQFNIMYPDPLDLRDKLFQTKEELTTFLESPTSYTGHIVKVKEDGKVNSYIVLEDKSLKALAGMPLDEIAALTEKLTVKNITFIDLKSIPTPGLTASKNDNTVVGEEVSFVADKDTVIEELTFTKYDPNKLPVKVRSIRMRATDRAADPTLIYTTINDNKDLATVIMPDYDIIVNNFVSSLRKFTITNNGTVDLSKMQYIDTTGLLPDSEVAFHPVEGYKIISLSFKDSKDVVYSAVITDDGTVATLTMPYEHLNYTELTTEIIKYGITNTKGLDISKLVVSELGSIVPGKTVTVTPVVDYKITALSFKDTAGADVPVTITTDGSSASFVMPGTNINYETAATILKTYNITFNESVDKSNFTVSDTTDILPGTVITFTANEKILMNSFTATGGAIVVAADKKTATITMPKNDVTITAFSDTKIYKITNTASVDISALTATKLTELPVGTVVTFTHTNPAYKITALSFTNDSSGVVNAVIASDGASASVTITATNLNIRTHTSVLRTYNITNTSSIPLTNLTISDQTDILPGTTITFSISGNYEITGLTLTNSTGGTVTPTIVSGNKSATLVMPSSALNIKTYTFKQTVFSISNPDNINIANLVASKTTGIAEGETVTFTVNGDYKITELTFETID